MLPIGNGNEMPASFHGSSGFVELRASPVSAKYAITVAVLHTQKLHIFPFIAIDYRVKRLSHNVNSSRL